MQIEIRVTHYFLKIDSVPYRMCLRFAKHMSTKIQYNGETNRKLSIEFYSNKLNFCLNSMTLRTTPLDPETSTPKN